MSIKILPFFAIILALVLVAKAASTDENVLPEIVFIENPDTFPSRLSPQEALLSPAQRNRICTAVLCARVCAALGFRLSRCNVNKLYVFRILQGKQKELKNVVFRHFVPFPTFQQIRDNACWVAELCYHSEDIKT